MSQQPFRKPFGIAGLLALCSLFALTLSASSCAQSNDSRLSAQPDAVMQSIRDYGRGHQAFLSSVSSEKPNETTDAYEARINDLTSKEEFAQLEKIARQNRMEKSRLLGGSWKIYDFYEGATLPESAGDPQAADFALRMTKLKKWIFAYPESAVPRLSLALWHIKKAWQIRGSGLANSVSDPQWEQFANETSQAKEILLETAPLKDKDPFWYQLTQRIARNESWDKARARELFDQAIAFEPGYYHYYREYANYLLPQWFGEQGDVAALAEETAKRVPEPDGSILYFQILSSLDCYCKDSITALQDVSYPKIRQGYLNNSRLYGVSNLTANRFAFMASILGDKPSAHDAFASVVSMEEDIWGSEQAFEQFRTWANAP
jgi:Domain of unknown function (DUF4034)